MCFVIVFSSKFYVFIYQSLFPELPHCPAKNWEATNPPLCPESVTSGKTLILSKLSGWWPLWAFSASANPGLLPGLPPGQLHTNGFQTIFLSFVLYCFIPARLFPSKTQIKLDFIWWFPLSEPFM